jgi:hypothetical protein
MRRGIVVFGFLSVFNPAARAEHSAFDGIAGGLGVAARNVENVELAKERERAREDLLSLSKGFAKHKLDGGDLWNFIAGNVVPFAWKERDFETVKTLFQIYRFGGLIYPEFADRSKFGLELVEILESGRERRFGDSNVYDYNAAGLLNRLSPDPKTEDALIDLLKKEKVSVKTKLRVLEILASWNTKKGIKAIGEIIADEPISVTRARIQILGKSKASESVELLREIRNQVKSPALKNPLAIALLEKGIREDGDRLFKNLALNEKRLSSTQFDLAVLLATTGTVEERRPYIELLKKIDLDQGLTTSDFEENDHLRAAAALAANGDKDAISYLRGLEAKGDRSATRGMYHIFSNLAIGRSRNEVFVPHLVRSIESSADFEGAIAALGEIGTSKAHDELIQYGLSAPQFSKPVIRALMKNSNTGTVRKLRALAKDERDPLKRWFLLSAFYQLSFDRVSY